jgi:tripartite-type tricarboxylate transporter receptor subunit TctC
LSSGWNTAVALIATLTCASAMAAQYPLRPVRMVVASPAGAHADQVARLIGNKLFESLGKQFVVDNRGGAGGIVGEELVARSQPDGHTLLLSSLSHVVNPFLNDKLPYQPLKDLATVSHVVSVPNVLLVHQSVSAKTVPELIALAKAKPGELNFAASQGTSLHLAGELFRTMAGVDIVRVNYKSGGLAYPDIEAGRVQMAFSVITGAIASVKGGRTRMIAVTSAKRSPVLPDLPAVAESVPGFELVGWQGIFVPAGTPRPIVQLLSTEIMKIMRLPDVMEKLISGGAHPVGTTPEAFEAFRQAEYQKYSKLLPRTAIKSD